MTELEILEKIATSVHNIGIYLMVIVFLLAVIAAAEIFK